ncbi:MAG: Asp-tRNA(Asn)/Glu-tRNA(Gln) amidotransferase GatCAB subunit A, partial [Nitrospirae bacterium]|nr:Asp-tRNA(Asn)/Glu-tRNA(Gln) amidotransferase GatCAB subunit A [Fimbriimonadaceae bacterium]
MITTLTASQLAEGLRRREWSAREVAQAHLDRIAAQDPRLGAFLTLDSEETMRWADAAQALLDAGEG